MSAKYDRFMVHVDVGTDEKLAGFTDSERLCHIAGVLALAAKSPIRGRLLVGEVVATADHVARRAGVTTRVARSTLRKLTEVGILRQDDEYDCLRVHNWDRFNPPPKRDATAAERQQRRRDRLRAQQAVTPASRRDTRDSHASVTPPEVEVEGEPPTVEEEDARTTGAESLHPALPPVVEMLSDERLGLSVDEMAVLHALMAHPWADKEACVSAARGVASWASSTSDPPRHREAARLLRSELERAAQRRRDAQVHDIRSAHQRRPVDPVEQDDAARLERMAARMNGGAA